METLNDSADDVIVRESILVTGFPAYTAQQLVSTILDKDETALVTLLCAEHNLTAAREFIAGRGAEQRVRLVSGRVDAMDLGLDGQEYEALRNSITTIQHMAGAYSLGNDRGVLQRINIIGTKNVLEFAHEARRLRRMCHWSSAFVSGKRKGVILEEELEEGQSFHNTYEESKYEAEVAVRHAQKHLPITVFRPALIVGDSQRGEIGPYDGPYELIPTLTGRGFPVSLSGFDNAPCHVVPIDYVIEAAYELSMDERTAGATFHLTDPNPLPVRIAIGLLTAETRGKPRPRLPASVARTLFRAPGLERLTRSIRPLLEAFAEAAFFNTRTTVQYLKDTDIACPSLDTYAEELVRFSRQPGDTEDASTAEEDTFDPLS